jgi:uncharacterized protein YdcH (DUF465 family)
MTQEEKARMYSSLLSEHDKISNQIASIKGESIDLNDDQLKRISKLQMKLGDLSNKMMNMMR